MQMIQEIPKNASERTQKVSGKDFEFNISKLHLNKYENLL